MKVSAIENLSIKIPREEAYPSLSKRFDLPEFFEARLVHVKTDEGIDGYADGTAGAAAARRLIGRDPTFIELLLEEGIIDNEPFLEHALWDLIGKASGLPVHKMLGGHKDKVKVYLTTVWKDRRKGVFGDPDDWAKVAEFFVEHDFKAMKIQVHRPKPFEDLKTIEAIRTGSAIRSRSCATEQGDQTAGLGLATSPSRWPELWRNSMSHGWKNLWIETT